jgi:glycopeptide antibiotics resistance protein
MPLVLLVLYSIPLLYGTLTPFRFTWYPRRDRMVGRSRVEWIPFTHLCPTHGIFCPTDMGLNIAIFIPVGALMALMPGSGSGARRRTIRAAAVGFCLSLLIETAQYFIPARFPSTTDVIWNTSGAFLGGLMVVGLVRRNPFAANQKQ